MRAAAAERPYWRYRHSPASVEPRHHHLAWDGLTLAHDDPWWQTNYPPNGWGCKCYVESLSRRDVERGGGPDEAPPLNRREVTVGSGEFARTSSVPEGVDPGFAHAPGLAASRGEAARRLLLAAVRQHPDIAARGVRLILRGPRTMGELTEAWRAWLRAEPGSGLSMDVGALLPAALDWWKRERGDVETAAVSIDRKDLAHAQRPTGSRRPLGAADLERLPEILAAPKAVLFDSREGTLIYAFDPEDPEGEGALGKVVVRVGRRGRNAVRSSGYALKGDLRGPGFLPVLGSLEDDD